MICQRRTRAAPLRGERSAADVKQVRGVREASFQRRTRAVARRRAPSCSTRTHSPDCAHRTGGSGRKTGSSVCHTFARALGAPEKIEKNKFSNASGSERAAPYRARRGALKRQSSARRPFVGAAAAAAAASATLDGELSNLRRAKFHSSTARGCFIMHPRPFACFYARSAESPRYA